MAFVQESRRFLFKNLVAHLKDSRDVDVKKSFSTTSLTFSKHYAPKWKWLRGKKVIPVDLPDFQKRRTPEEMRSEMKELGILPPRFWRERPITVTCSPNIMDPFEPPKGDGKTSFLSKTSVQSLLDATKHKKDDYLALRKIKSYEPEFDSKTFPQHAHDIYVKAHTTLMDLCRKDPQDLSEFVTEIAIAEMTNGLKNKTLKWKFIESLEPPTLIQARYDKVVSEDNLFAQITVRFHTKQILAIYDRFGRLMYGHEDIPKDVLEYVIFEKHIVNEYGTWRLHGKIIPEWIPVIDTARTYRVEKVKEEEEEEIDEEEKFMQNMYQK